MFSSVHDCATRVPLSALQTRLTKKKRDCRGSAARPLSKAEASTRGNRMHPVAVLQPPTLPVAALHLHVARPRGAAALRRSFLGSDNKRGVDAQLGASREPRAALGTPQLSRLRRSRSWYHSGRLLSCAATSAHALHLGDCDSFRWPWRRKAPTSRSEHSELLRRSRLALTRARRTRVLFSTDDRPHVWHRGQYPSHVLIRQVKLNFVEQHA